MKPRRGSALLLTLFFLMVLHLLATAFITLVPTEMNSATRHKSDAVASLVADAGLQDTLQWLRNLAEEDIDAELAFEDLWPTPDTDEPATMQRYFRRTDADAGYTTSSGWRWEARVFPDPQTSGYPGNVGSYNVRAYKVKVLAYYDPGNVGDGRGLRRSVSAWISQSSFAERNWLYGTVADIWLNMGTFSMEGKLHTNAKLQLAIPSGYDWNNVQGTNAPFQDEVTFALNTNFNNSSAPGAIRVDGIRYLSWDESRLPYETDMNGGVPASNFGDPIAAGSATRYQRLTTRSFTQTEVIDMPDISADLAKAAWGGTVPSTNPGSATGPKVGITVNGGSSNVDTLTIGSTNVGVKAHNNGIYIAGQQTVNMNGTGGNLADSDPRKDVLEMEMSLSGENQVVRIRQRQGNHSNPNNGAVQNVWRSVTTTFEPTPMTFPAGSTVNGVAVSGNVTVPEGYTIVRNNESTNSYEILKGTGNGLIYHSNGDVVELEGVNKGRKTIAVNQADNRAIQITDHLTRADTTPGQRPASGAVRDQLGLIAHDVRFASRRTNPALNVLNINRSLYTQANPLYLYVAIFAGDDGSGGVSTVGYNDGSLGAGHFVLYGSMSEGNRGAKGTFNPTTGQTASGLGYTFKVDPNFAVTAPPFFPASSFFRVLHVTEKTYGG